MSVVDAAPTTTSATPLPEFVYHIADAARWVECLSTSYYFPTSLETEGFIHLSTEEQVMGVLTRFYAVTDPETSPLLRDKTTGETNLLLLRIATGFPGFVVPVVDYKTFHATATPESVVEAGCVLIMEPPIHPKVTGEGKKVEEGGDETSASSEGIMFVEGAPLYPHAYGRIPICAVDDAVKIYVDPSAGYKYGEKPYTLSE